MFLMLLFMDVRCLNHPCWCLIDDNDKILSIKNCDTLVANFCMLYVT